MNGRLGNQLGDYASASDNMIPNQAVDMDWETPGPTQGIDWCRSTTRSDKIYLHVFDWPPGGELKLPDLPVLHANLLSDAEANALPLEHAENNLIINGPTEAPEPINTVIALTVE